MNIFLDEKTKEGIARRYTNSTVISDYLTDQLDCDTIKELEALEKDVYLAGWNECEKHVRESVSEGFGEWWADFIRGHLGPEMVAVPELKIKKAWQAAKLSSLVEIEQLKAQIKKRDEALIEVTRIVEEYKDFFAMGDNIHSFYCEHQSLINQIKESGE